MDPTPKRQNKKTYLTPDFRDFILVESEDITKKSSPARGTPHPDKNKFPNHKFSHAAVADDQGVLYSFFYVASRDSQEDYNWEYTKADIGGNKFNSITATYAIPRNSFTPDSPAMGSPAPEFSGGATGYILAERKQVRSPDRELDGYLIFETRVYVKKCTTRQIGVDSLNGKALFSDVTLHYRGEIIPAVEEYSTATISGTVDLDINGDYLFVGEDLYLPDRYEATVGGKDIRIFFDEASSQWNILNVTDFVTLWVSETTTLEATPDPSGVATWTDYNPTQSGSPVVTHEVVGAVAAITIEDLVEDSANAYWGLFSNGTQREGQHISCNWFSVTLSQVVGGVFANGVVQVDTYSTNRDYSWPPVLSALVLKNWARRDGGTDIYPTTKYSPEGYSGPCKATVTRTWSASPFTIDKVDQMLPTPIQYTSPFFSLNIGRCLHGAITVVCDIGTSDPTYKVNSGSSEVFAATNHLVWPDSITAYDEQTTFRGGFLRTSITIFKPE